MAAYRKIVRSELEHFVEKTYERGGTVELFSPGHTARANDERNTLFFLDTKLIMYLSPGSFLASCRYP